MNEAIINSIYAFGGTLIGILISLIGITITLFIQKRNSNRDNLKRDIDRFVCVGETNYPEKTIFHKLSSDGSL